MSLRFGKKASDSSCAKASSKSKAVLQLFFACLLMALSCMLFACSQGTETQKSGSEQASQQAAPASEQKEITVGTLPTEDFLPFWFAEDHAYLQNDKTGPVKLVQFQSAQELAAALSSGVVDMAMTDIPVAANLSKAGNPMRLAWVTLGASPTEGRFGIMVAKDSPITELAELKGKGIGVGSGTMLEYVMDKLLEEQGFTKDEIKVEELKVLPARLEAVLQNKVAAGIFPATLLEIGELSGARILADDTKGSNLSQSVMAVQEKLLQDPAAHDRVLALREVWAKAASEINADKEAGREVLLKKLNLPEPLKAKYPIQSYPAPEGPKAQEVQSVLDWMKERGYLDGSLEYIQDKKDAPLGGLLK